MWKTNFEKLHATYKKYPFAEAFGIASGLYSYYLWRDRDVTIKQHHKELIEAQRRHNKVVIVDYPERVEFLKGQKVQAEVDSIRNEVGTIRMAATRLQKGEFILIRGPRGVGKTSAIDTALKGTEGVIRIGPIEPGTDQDVILNKVCNLITGLDGGWEENRHAMEMLTKMYQEKCGSPLTVLIQASERPLNSQPAQLTAAARILADSFKVTVIIDCSENACPPTFTGREDVLNFEPMSYEKMRELPRYLEIAKEIEEQGNADIALAICGGRPLLLNDLTRAINSARQRGLKMEDGVRDFVIKNLTTANISISKVVGLPGVKQVLEEFRTKSNIKFTDENAKLPDMKDVKDVLRLVEAGLFVPATGAVALQLRMGLENRNFSFNEAKEWLNKQNESVKAALLCKETNN